MVRTSRMDAACGDVMGLLWGWRCWKPYLPLLPKRSPLLGENGCNSTIQYFLCFTRCRLSGGDWWTSYIEPISWGALPQTNYRVSDFDNAVCQSIKSAVTSYTARRFGANSRTFGRISQEPLTGTVMVDGDAHTKTISIVASGLWSCLI